MPAACRIAVLLSCLILFPLAGCGDDDESEAPPTATPVNTPTPTATPQGGSAAAGETAFYETLLGVADRNEEALTHLSAAVAQDPQDGRSWFLKGMTHLWRLARVWTDVENPGDFVAAEIVPAREALEHAVPLVPEDTRIPGFHGAARYNEGIILDDAAIAADGLRLMREAMSLNFLFNSFDFVGTVPFVVRGDDPLMAESLDYLERGLMMIDQCTPRICGNEGYAPHNGEGTFVLFGDLYAKAGNRARALEFYSVSETLGAGGNWRYKDLLAERIRDIDLRIALYTDAERGNDPPLIGQGPEACSYCHYQ